MAHKSIFWDNNNLDSTVHGQKQKHIDARITPEASKDWNKEVIIDPDSFQALIPLDCVDELISENQELREALFYVMTDSQEKAIQSLYHMVGHSTSDIIKIVDSIVVLSGKAFTSQDVYRTVYNWLRVNHGVDFNQVPQGVTKLQWCWKMGYLPLVSVFLSCFNQMLKRFSSKNSIKFKQLCQEIVDSTPTPKKTIRSIGVQSP